MSAARPFGLVFSGLLCALSACSSDGKDFAYERAAAICAWHERCDTLKAAGFDDATSCEDELKAAADQLASQGELNCSSVDADAAAACLAVWADTSCEEDLNLSVCETVCTEGR